MDIRPLGTPLTASQRRSYRETPDSGFYQRFQAACAAHTADPADPGARPDNAARTATLADILGATHADLSAMRGVSTASQERYAAVLQKAYARGGMDNARQFLGSLSADELEAVRQNHCLADPVQVAALSEEGARNLLLPEGYAVDLNHDGIDEVGAARTVSFPPREAPAAFREAWFQATADMDAGMAMSYGLTLHGAVYGLAIDGPPAAPRHDPTRLDSYRQVVSDALAALEAYKGWLAEGQYERDKDFFGRLQALLPA